MYYFTQQYLFTVHRLIDFLDTKRINTMIEMIVQTRNRGGRLFILGVGGSAANASHAVNDFRKILDIETYTPTDNVAELTARTNDDGWEGTFGPWLQVNRLNEKDAVLVLSVGGGHIGRNISPNLVYALQEAKTRNSVILGIVSRDGGYTAQVADCCIIIPVLDEELITPLAESFQSIILHLIVSHPRFRKPQTKAVFLDRDGVLNKAIIRDGLPLAPYCLEDFHIENVLKDLQLLKMYGFKLIVVTNQPDVSRGLVTLDVIEEMHDKLKIALPLDDIFVCCHDDADNCSCRKPKPGMIFQAAEKYAINLSYSFLIGDRQKDIDAGNKAGCKSILIGPNLTFSQATNYILDKYESTI